MPVIEAKRRSRCRACGNWVEVGEKVDYSRLNGALHLACSDGGDPEDDIRRFYTDTVGKYVKQGTTTQVSDDGDAFDACVQEYGYVPTVRALLGISAQAKRKNDEYEAKVKHNQVQSRSRRSGFRRR